MILELIPHAIGLTCFAWFTFYGWRMAKALLGADDYSEMYRLEAERELRLAQGRARRLRTARYQDEHSAWDEEFRALGGGCACHGGPRRSRLR